MYESLHGKSTFGTLINLQRKLIELVKSFNSLLIGKIKLLFVILMILGFLVMDRSNGIVVLVLEICTLELMNLGKAISVDDVGMSLLALCAKYELVPCIIVCDFNSTKSLLLEENPILERYNLGALWHLNQVALVHACEKVEMHTIVVG